jgi:hypothetical protein
MAAPTQVFGPGTTKRWIPVAVIGSIAVIAGIAFPRTLPSPAPDSVKLNVKSEPEAKGKFAYSPPVEPEMPDARAMLTRLGVATAAVLALCAGTLWMGRRWLGGPPAKAGQARHLHLVETLALGNRCLVHLVEVGGRPI